MRSVIGSLVIVVVFAAGVLSPSPSFARGCVDGVRIFADVPGTHPLCAEIESLYRDGLTRGCGMDEDGNLLFCPADSLTRGAAAAFTRYRDPFAQVEHNGRLAINDHVVDADRVQTGVYYVQFSRDIQFCSREGWPHNFVSDAIRVRVTRLAPTIDTVMVETTFNGSPADMTFNVRLHCR